MNKKYSCIAQIFVTLVFVSLLPTSAQSCIPVPPSPLKPEYLQPSYVYRDGVMRKADIIFIGTLIERWGHDPEHPKAAGKVVVLKIEKPIKNAEQGTYHARHNNIRGLDCGRGRDGGLYLYQHIPATKPPEELLKEPSIPFDELSGKERHNELYRRQELMLYEEEHHFLLLRDEQGKFFPEDAKLIKDKFGYDITPKSEK